MSLATKLVTLRKEKGLTQMELAERLNVSRQAISRWEVGAAVPSTENLKVLSELYETTVDYLLSENESHICNFSESNVPPQCEPTNVFKVKRNQLIAVCIAVLVFIITVIVISTALHNRRDENAVPLHDMDMDRSIENEYTTYTFYFE